ncbi:MAG: hypothetical protein JSS40_06440 [Proteobacteria bacterium]|nr:hypothetical protein [Pseudomonadota bacterium]
MKHPAPKKASHPARPIKTKRDHKGASEAAKSLAAHPARDSAAEKRLQSLLHELDKFDEPESDDGGDAADGYDYSGPARRWSDDTPDDA